MVIRRLSEEDITGQGVVNTAPAVPVPTPNTGNTGGGGTTPNTGTTTTGINPAGGTMNFNPIPNNTPVNPGDAVGFVTNFRFGPENRTGIPQNDLAQDTFNKIADTAGHNAAWTWMMQNAWNQLGGYGPGGMREIMDKAGIERTDHNRIINTYGTNAKYFDGLRSDTKSMGSMFNPKPQITAILAPWRDYQAQFAKNYGNKAWQYQLPQDYQPYQSTTAQTFKATGTNIAPEIPVGYGGQVGINPVGDPAAYNKFYGATPEVAVPKPEPKGPAVAQVVPGVAQTPAPAVTPAGTDLNVQRHSQQISTTNPTGAPGQAPYRFRPNR